MKSIFRAEKVKSGTYTHVFADIQKRDTFIVNRTLTEEEVMELNERNITQNNSLNIIDQELTE